MTCMWVWLGGHVTLSRVARWSCDLYVGVARWSCDLYVSVGRWSCDLYVGGHVTLRWVNSQLSIGCQCNQHVLLAIHVSLPATCC